MMTAERFAQMKQGSYFLNLARGTVVDIDALAANLRSKKILGAAVDVFLLSLAATTKSSNRLCVSSTTSS